MAFPFVLFYQEYIENVVGAAIGRPYSFIHKHGRAASDRPYRMG